MSLVSIYTTTATQTQAEKIAERLVKDRLVACANIVPAITSIYEWEGELKREQETAVYLKTTAALAEDVCAALREHHPYQTPAILVLPVQSADGDYAAWVAAQTGGTLAQ